MEGGEKKEKPHRLAGPDTIGVIWMWIVLAILTVAFIGVCYWCEWYNGNLDSRQTKIGFWGAGNFLHGTPMDNMPIF